MVRPVTDDDIGLKVLREAPADATEIVDIVAIHGIGAYLDNTWCKNVGTAESPQWFSEVAMRQKASPVAQRLLLALRRKREVYPYRPLLFIAHCFGGLVLLKVNREYHEDEVRPEVLKILQPGNEFLQELVNQFRKTRLEVNKLAVTCFYELKSSNVGKIVGRKDRTVGVGNGPPCY
ncbi:hypothetical protein BCR34DRAFT_621771 [Clohesyomyces aquaticus]|uniref:Uncharacterized protein n=1 Tax=Clohesyomyces aquaticus TaxID=1231657 RepID=A0A1Y2A4Z8_9PLEO|nr:hypothetical protein BCR34DRAFT_621771 [Clohesyomyces aquaticus]